MVNSVEIKVYMTRKGNMTVKELAQKIGVSPATLGRWLEKYDMPASAAEKIAKILDIPDDKVMTIFFCPFVAC